MATPPPLVSSGPPRQKPLISKTQDRLGIKGYRIVLHGENFSRGLGQAMRHSNQSTGDKSLPSLTEMTPGRARFVLD